MPRRKPGLQHHSLWGQKGEPDLAEPAYGTQGYLRRLLVDWHTAPGSQSEQMDHAELPPHPQVLTNGHAGQQ